MITERNTIADLLKGIAVILMIQVHLTELFASPEIFNSSVGKTSLLLGGAPVAPVFMAILGYFIANTKKSQKQIIVRGIKIIILGFVLNILLNLNLIVSVINGLYKINLFPYIFGVDILPFAGLSIIIIGSLKSFIENKSYLLILISLLCVLFGSFLLQYLPTNLFLKYILAFLFGCAEWSYFPLLPWFAYPLIGFSFYQINKKQSFLFLQFKLTKVFVVVLFIVFLFFTLNYATLISSNLQNYYHHNVIFYIWTLAFICFYTLILTYINELLFKSFLLEKIKWLGKNVTQIYLIQWIIIGNVATEIYKTIDEKFYLLLSFILVLLASILITHFFNYIKTRKTIKVF